MPLNGDDFQYATGIAPRSAGIPTFRIAGFHPANSEKSLVNDLMKLRDPFAFVSAPTGKSATRQTGTSALRNLVVLISKIALSF